MQRQITPSSEQPLLVIWGTSGHALVVTEIVRLQGVYKIIGYLDDINVTRHGAEFCGATILGGREQLKPLLEQGVRHTLLGFGDCTMRLVLAQLVSDQGFSLATAIHPRAVVAEDVVLGPGTVIMAGAVVNPGVRIGGNVIINTSASIDHECVIGDSAHICPGAHLAGQVVVGATTQVGIGATVVERVRIGTGAVIGAGAVVVSDIPDHVVAYGVPARVRRMVDR